MSLQSRPLSERLVAVLALVRLSPCESARESSNAPSVERLPALLALVLLLADLAGGPALPAGRHRSPKSNHKHIINTRTPESFGRDLGGDALHGHIGHTPHPRRTGAKVRLRESTARRPPDTKCSRFPLRAHARDTVMSRLSENFNCFFNLQSAFTSSSHPSKP